MFDLHNQFYQIILILIGLINIFSLILFYIDKKRARNRQFRISEKTLLLSAFLGGGIGAWLGMTTFRHKTKHTQFKIGIPFAALITLGAILFVLLK